MANSKKRDTTTGNGSTKNPILASENVPTAGRLEQSQPLTSIGEGSTKPRSLAEALSLWQTNCFDLRSMGCEVTILARGKRLYMILAVPPDTGNLDVEQGHITIAGKPVLLG